MIALYEALPSWFPAWPSLSYAPEHSVELLMDVIIGAAAASLAWALAMNARRQNTLYEALHALLLNSQHLAASSKDAELNSRRTLTVLQGSLSDFRSIAERMAEGQRRVDELVKTQSTALDAHRKGLDATVEAFFEKLTGHADSLAAAPQSFAASVYTLSGVAVTIENLVDLHSNSIAGLVREVEKLQPRVAETAASLDIGLSDKIEKQLGRYRHAVEALNEELGASLQSRISAQRKEIAEELGGLLSQSEQVLKDLCVGVTREVESLDQLWRGVDGKLGHASDEMMRRWSSRLTVMQKDLNAAVIDVTNALADRVDALTLAVGMNADVVKRDIFTRIEDIKKTANIYGALAETEAGKKHAHINDVLERITERVDETCCRLDVISRDVEQELNSLVQRANDLAHKTIAPSTGPDPIGPITWSYPHSMQPPPSEAESLVEQVLTSATRALRAARS